MCCFNQNLRGTIADSRFFAPHYTSNCKRFFRIADQQRALGKLSCRSIEKLQRILFFCLIDEDMLSFDFFGIEDVKRLPHLEHDEVADVDEVIYAFLTCSFETCP